MSWKDLLENKWEEKTIILPWVGGRTLRSFKRTWKITGKLPEEYGWHKFNYQTKTAQWRESADFQSDILKNQVKGYLIGDRLVSDSVKNSPNINELASQFEKVYLIEPGLDRFVRVIAGRFHENSPLIYESMDMPLGPEDDVLKAFQDQEKTVNAIPGVIPALDAAFRIESWRRDEIERRRREAQERQEREERRKRLFESLGNAAGRREMAQENFGEAARAALAVGGAVYLDHRRAYNPGEMTVRFRLNGARYECVCNSRTLGIIDSGICLTAEYNDGEFEAGTRGDTWLTLESLPPTILQAQRERRLVVFRHVE